MRVLLDISRTIARARLPAQTGIDRVERAYIRWALDREALFLGQIDGKQYVVSSETARALIDWLDGKGDAPRLDIRSAFRPHRDEKLRRAQSLIRREAAGELDRTILPEDLGLSVYLNVGHDNLSKDLIARLRKAGMPTAVLIHDLIPLDHPDLVRAETPWLFRKKFDAAMDADGLICNSEYTFERVQAHARSGARKTAVAPLGIEPVLASDNNRAQKKFLCIGTIEPRKNHALLLEIWSGFWSRLGLDAPHLHIIGRRGWKNESVFRILDSASMMGRVVFEHGAVDDRSLADELSTATAMLFPSLAEGFGLPLGEALAAGCPVLASDLPALREVGGDVPEWFAPNDAYGWLGAIEDYMDPAASRSVAQILRLQQWKPTTWHDHFDIVEKHLETNLVQSGVGG